MGLKRLRSLRDAEGQRTFVNNPHELARLLECYAIMDIIWWHFESCKARKASSDVLNFHRVDYPEVDPDEWDCFIPIKQIDGVVTARKLDHEYYREAPYSDVLLENYEKYTVEPKVPVKVPDWAK